MSKAECCQAESISKSRDIEMQLGDIVGLSHEVKELAENLRDYFHGNCPCNSKNEVKINPVGYYDILHSAINSIREHLIDAKQAIKDCK